jgi:hypothetical protein
MEPVFNVSVAKSWTNHLRHNLKLHLLIW